MNAKDWRFPMICPQCESPAGRPLAVQIENRELVLRLHCVSCAHEWAVSAPAPETFESAPPRILKRAG
jgi:hypothetical protein